MIIKLIRIFTIDEALSRFNQLMSMETFALTDDTWHSTWRADLNDHESYKTRLVRVDLAPCNGRSLLEVGLNKCVRTLWWHWTSNKISTKGTNFGTAAPDVEKNLRTSYRDTIRIASFLTRFLVALFAGLFLVGPLVLLSYQSSKEAHLLTVGACIVIFSFIVSLASKASAQETMAASAAYAAVLVVFVSNS